LMLILFAAASRAASASFPSICASHHHVRHDMGMTAARHNPVAIGGRALKGPAVRHTRRSARHRGRAHACERQTVRPQRRRRTEGCVFETETARSFTCEPSDPRQMVILPGLAKATPFTYGHMWPSRPASRRVGARRAEEAKPKRRRHCVGQTAGDGVASLRRT
jgi:hypothetical protein